MQITFDTSSPDYTKIILEGRLDTAGVDAIESRFSAASVATGKSTIVDLSRVPFVASMGIRLLVETAKGLSRKQARLVILEPQEIVDEYLREADLYQLIPVARDDEEARALLTGD